MKKLKLELDDLTVEAFETLKSPAAEGTVMGHEGTNGETCETQCWSAPCLCWLTDPLDRCG